MTVTPTDLLQPGEQLGLADDTDIMQRVLDRFAASDERVLKIDGDYVIDRTLVCRRWPAGKVVIGPGSFRQVTDTGGLTDEGAITGRALLRFEYGEQVSLGGGLRLLGPKKRPGRNRTYEGQHGIHAVGTQGISLECVTIERVHGDNFNGASHHRDPNFTPIRDVSIQWCNFGMSGRAGVCLNDFQGATIMHTTFTDQGSTNMLVEAGHRPKVNRNLMFSKNVIVRGGSYSAHLVGGGRSALEDVWITDNYRSGPYAFCVAVDGPDQITPSGQTLADWPIYERIRVIGNGWEKPDAPGKLFRFRDAEDVLLAHNGGPVRDPALLSHNGQPNDGKKRPYVANCTGFKSGPNKFYLV